MGNGSVEWHVLRAGVRAKMQLLHAAYLLDRRLLHEPIFVSFRGPC